MADAAAARREARRKRILENSGNRLQLITAIVGNECTKESPTRFPVPVPDYQSKVTRAPESSSTLLPLLNNGVLHEPESESLTLLSPRHELDAAGDGEIVNDLAALLLPSSEPVKTPSSLPEKLLINRYDIVLLSIFIQILNSLSILTPETGYFFLPLIIYFVTKLIWFPTHSKSSIANALLLLNGISASRVDKILNVSQWAGVIAQDVCVYLFVTICIQSLLDILNDNLIT